MIHSVFIDNDSLQCSLIIETIERSSFRRNDIGLDKFVSGIKVISDGEHTEIEQYQKIKAYHLVNYLICITFISKT